MVNKQTIKSKIFHLVLSGVLLFYLGAIVLSPQPVSASPDEKALSFNGVNDYVDCGNDASLDITDAITTEAWVKFTSLSGTGSTRTLWNKGSQASNAHHWFRWSETNAQWDWELGSGTIRYSLSYAHTPTLGQWYHIVGTYDSADEYFRLYLDGVEVASSHRAGFGTLGTNTRDALIGAYYDGSMHLFNGIIDEVRISDIARTPEEITANWNEGFGNRLENDANTVALWHMDEGSGSTINDETGINHGTIYGATFVDGFSFPAEEGPEGPVELWHDGLWVEDYGAIQAAIDAAEVGDTIIVHAGIYDEHLFIDKTLTFKSTAGEVIIDGESSASGPSLQPESDIMTYPVVWIDAHNVVFGVLDGSYGGFTVKNAAPWGEIYDGEEFWGYSVGIAVFIRAYECVIENNIITNNTLGLQVKGDDNQILSNEFSNNDMAVMVDRGDGNIIGTAAKGNTLHDNGPGVMFFDTPSGTVENNFLYSNFAGILLSSPRCHDIEIIGNTIEDCTGGSFEWAGGEEEGMLTWYVEATAILMEGGIYGMEGGPYNNTVSGNTIAAADYGIHLRSAGYNGAGNEIDGENDISDCAKAGIFLEYCWEEDIVGWNDIDNCRFGIQVLRGRNNDITANEIGGGELGEHGIMVEDSDNNLLQYNTIYGQQHHGIVLKDNYQSSVEGNTVYDNRNGIFIADCNDNRVEGNTTYSGTTGNSEAGIDVYNSENIAILSNETWYNGEWGIFFHSNSWHNIISNNTIRYNGHGVWIEGGENRVLGNEFIENTAGGSGVHITAGAHNNEVRWNNFIDNITGLYAEEWVYAEDNWWGDITGPSGSGPGSGAGDAVYGNVDFDPWATSPFTIPEPGEVVPSLTNEIALPNMVSMWDYEEGGPAPGATGRNRAYLLVKVDEPQSGLEEVTIDLRAVLEDMLPDIQTRAAAELEEHELDEWNQWMYKLERTQMRREHYSYWDEAAGEQVWEEAWRYQWEPKWLFDQLRGFFDDEAVRDMFSAEAVLGDFSITLTATDWAGHSATSEPVKLTIVDMMRPLAAGWNLVSTPITLGEPEWGDVTSLGDGMGYDSILRYKGGKWQSYGTDGEDTGWCEDGFYVEAANFRPLEAIYIKADSNDQLGLIWDRNSAPTAPPSLDLDAGWSLVAPACRGMGMAVDEALASETGYRVISPGKEFNYRQEFCDANYGGGEWGFGSQDWWFQQSAWSHTAGYGNSPIMTVIGGYWLSTDSAYSLVGHTTTPIPIPLSPEPVREPPDLPRYQQVLMTDGVEYQLDGKLQVYITYQGDVSPSQVSEMYLREMSKEPYNWQLTDSTLGEEAAHLNFQRRQGAAVFNAVIDITRGEGIHVDYELTEAGRDIADVPRFEWGPELVMTYYATYYDDTNIQYQVHNLDNEIEPNRVKDFYEKYMWECGWNFDDETWNWEDGYERVTLEFSKEGRHCTITAERWYWDQDEEPRGIPGGLITIHYHQQ